MPEISKVTKKSSFLRSRFFNDFLDGQKIQKKLPKMGLRRLNFFQPSEPGPWGRLPLTSGAVPSFVAPETALAWTTFQKSDLAHLSNVFATPKIVEKSGFLQSCIFQQFLGFSEFLTLINICFRTQNGQPESIFLGFLGKQRHANPVFIF